MKQFIRWALAGTLLLTLAGCGGGGTGGGSGLADAGPPPGASIQPSQPVPVSSGTPQATPTPTPAPTATPKASPTPTPTPASSPTPTPTPKASPSPTPAPSPGAVNPFAGASMYVDPNSAAAQQVAAWQTSQPADAAELTRISTQPQAKWMSGGTTAIGSGDVQWFNQRFADGTLPVVVLYHLPQISLGAGPGASNSPEAYQSWIRSVAAAIGTHKAVIVLEPDALGQQSSRTAADQNTVYGLLSYAVTTLRANAGTAVYIDAGNPGWTAATLMSQRLILADVAHATGFSLNVSNYQFTSACLTYGETLAASTGGKHFIVDTGRNGLGPDPNNIVMNAPGRALGPRFTTSTGSAHADAFMFIKNPGFSDGAVNGGPAWGFWPAYALGLCQRAAY